MKKIGVMVILGLILSISASAQYKVNKDIYNHQDYRPQAGDPYNPTVAGLASFFIPGLGQMVSGEAGRGLGFLAAYTGSFVVYFAGASKFIETGGDKGTGTMLIGLGGALTFGIWSIVDAVHVAKVNNLASRNGKISSNFKLQPYLCKIPNQNKLATGLTLRINLSN